MSQLSFICFCVEHYADHVHRPSNEVYQLFKQEGLLDLLRSDFNNQLAFYSEAALAELHFQYACEVEG